jgi:hypothetical protein
MTTPPDLPLIKCFKKDNRRVFTTWQKEVAKLDEFIEKTKPIKNAMLDANRKGALPVVLNLPKHYIWVDSENLPQYYLFPFKRV